MSSFRRLSSELLVLVLVCAAAACGGSPTSPSGEDAPYSTSDLRIGTGAAVTNGSNVTVNYTGWLYSSSRTENKGTRFDSGTIRFIVGSNQVVRGMDMGVVGMRVGGQRRIVVSSELGYGSLGQGPIPPNSAMVFEVEIVDSQSQAR